MFQKQCEGILQEQKRMTELANELGRNLKYYTFLEPVTRRLNAPGAGSFVRSKEFSEMLSRIDECLEYMSVHVSSMISIMVFFKANIAAVTPGSIDLSVTIPFIVDQRIDVDPRTLCWCITRNSFRCCSKDLRSTTEWQHYACFIVCQVPGWCLGAKGSCTRNSKTRNAAIRSWTWRRIRVPKPYERTVYKLFRYTR